jgi:ligand-binding sensor domain-containing protein
VNRLIPVFLFLFFSECCFSQHLNFFKPEKLRNIPASETYNIMQDSKGYIWFSSEAGLCRYNGKTIKVFDEKNGLKEKSTYVVYEDEQNKLWIVTSANRILNYVNDSLKEASFSKSYVKYFENKFLHTYQLRSVDSVLWTCDQYHSYRISKNTGNIQPVKFPGKDEVYYFRREGNQLVPLKRDDNNVKDFLPRIFKRKSYDLIIEDQGKIKRISIPFNRNYSAPNWRSYSVTNYSGESFLSIDNILIKFNPDLTYEIHEYPQQILAVYIDKENGLWLGMRKSGVYYIPSTSKLNEHIHSLPEYTVSGICEDHENGIWISTLENGIYYCRNKNLVHYNNISGLSRKAEILEEFSNKIYTSSDKDEIIEMDNKDIISHKLNLHKGGYSVNDIVQEPNGWLVVGKEFIARCDKKFKNPRFIVFHGNKLSRVGANHVATAPSGKKFGIHFKQLNEIGEQNITELTSDLPSPGRTIFHSEIYGLLIGCQDGLYRIRMDNFSHHKMEGIDGNVSRIFETSSGQLWIATKGSGLFMMEGDKIRKMDEILQIQTRIFFDIEEDKNNNLWAASNIGLIKITNYLQKPGSAIYTTLHGLPSNEVYQVEANDRSVFFSTAEGLVSFPLEKELANFSAPGLYIDSIWVNGEPVDKMNIPKLFSYDQNSIRISFDVLTFKESESELLAYKLSSGGPWSFSRNRELILNNLIPGKYDIIVYGINNDKKLSKAPFVFSFEILLPFWKTKWFIGVGIVVFGFGLYLVIRLLITRVRKKEEEKTRVSKLLAEYQLSALRAQMNPHFIFNCINSIQRYILTNESESAFDYLSKFSKLIRLVLNSSDKNMITLDQELEIVELYFAMEQLRFDNKFTYSIICDPGVDPHDLEVPTMMLQPYIENAIWHGIMNLTDRKGHIDVRISHKDNVLKIIVEDNGVGRQFAGKRVAKGHISKSSVINEKRTEILNLIYNNVGAGNVLLEDVKDIHHQVKGTRVIINITQNTYYES